MYIYMYVNVCACNLSTELKTKSLIEIVKAK